MIQSIPTSTLFDRPARLREEASLVRVLRQLRTAAAARKRHSIRSAAPIAATGLVLTTAIALAASLLAASLLAAYHFARMDL